ncbi:hypothetical protein PENSPDRAFT_415195 [Peniophora sp. CONT]|nr:hypothetical protein PENSPDRAFT_415195 [Peniophora sp. CONT]
MSGDVMRCAASLLIVQVGLLSGHKVDQSSRIYCLIEISYLQERDGQDESISPSRIRADVHNCCDMLSSAQLFELVLYEHLVHAPRPYNSVSLLVSPCEYEHTEVWRI